MSRSAPFVGLEPQDGSQPGLFEAEAPPDQFEGVELPPLDMEAYSKLTKLSPPRPHERFAVVRQRLGASQAAMAAFIGIGRNAYANHEKRVVAISAVEEAALRALAHVVEAVREAGKNPAEALDGLLEIGIEIFLAYPEHARSAEGTSSPTPEQTRRGRLGALVKKGDVKALRERKLWWSLREMADFFLVAHSTANAWEHETEAIQPPVAGAVRALHDEMVFRGRTLKHDDWLEFRKALLEMGVAAFLVGRRAGPDWDWRAAATAAKDLTA